MNNLNNIRLFLWLTLAGIAWLTYTAWNADYGRRAVTSPTPTEQTSGAPSTDIPRASPGSGAAQPQVQAPQQQAAAATGELIHVRTDVLDLAITTQGGDLVRADLLRYPVDKDDPEHLVRLLDDSGPTRWVFQSGVSSAVGGAEPTHVQTFRSDSNEYVLAPGQDELVVTLDWVGDGPLGARKTYTFRRGRYDISLNMTVAPSAGSIWQGTPYVRMERQHVPARRSYMSPDSYSFKGPVLYDGDAFERIKFEDLVRMPETRDVRGGWFASIQHHFLAAAVPPSDAVYHYEATATGQYVDDELVGGPYVLTAVGPVTAASAAMPLSTTFTLFVGPKLQKQLQEVGSDLERTVDYGITTPLAQPLFTVLDWVHGWVGNWGWAIIIVTILIKAAFYKLTAMSGRSMAKMRKIAPRMKALQERYKDDREGLSKAMMELYKKEKVNPAAGCLPILIQMPFFFAFYWVLVESVEMRQAPFALWLQDLSARDPFYVLPACMAAAMFFQTRMSPAPPDPVQARMMQIMPLVFAAFLVVFPAGLVLYQLTNTTLSILQQWRINKLVARESAAT
ncbi:MAG TPA: membrane protein insertase YidC [Gammaproteobacteria bacterium]|nr:membrane protein insertase YidC [Gammaproteobacteria bacterium]